MSEYFKCPVCGEDDFDAIGLKGHFMNDWCEPIEGQMPGGFPRERTVASAPAPQSPDQACGAEGDAAFMERMRRGEEWTGSSGVTLSDNDWQRLIALASHPAPADAVRVLVEALERIVDDGAPWAAKTAGAALSDPRVIAAQSADPWCYDWRKAPTDGTPYLLATAEGTGPTIGAFEDGYHRVLSNRHKITGSKGWAWMPLPAAPARQQEEPS